MLPFILATLAVAALLPIIAPLLRGSRPVASRSSFDQSVYRDQLRELDRDIVRGLIMPSDGDATRLEIQRRLLAADKLRSAPPRLSRSPILAVAVVVVVAAGSGFSYFRIGTPGQPDEPFADRKLQVAQEGESADGNQAALQQAIIALAKKLEQNPSDAPVWLLYARSLAMLSHWDQAEDAYRHAMDLGQTDPDVGAAHAEMMVMQTGGTVTPAAEAAFRQVLNADPSSGIARYYLAMALAQAGEPRKALDGFQALLAELPPDSPLRGQVGEMITEAARVAGVKVPDPLVRTVAQAPGPDAVAVAAAAKMTDDQRQAMVRGMVGKLEAKLQAEPANLDGWLRLGQAYAVLHDPDKAADAYDKAARLRPGDVSIRLQEVRMLLNETDTLPPRVKDLLRQAEVMAPEQPLVLWYLGIAAAREAHADEARRYWGLLLAKLPEGGDDANAIRSAIDTLGRSRDSHATN